MWLFYSPKNYSEMVEKISKSIFIITATLIYLLSCFNNDFSNLLKEMSPTAEYDLSGLKLNAAIFYLPLLFGILEHMFKIHDLLSSLFRIRYRYDRNVIVARIMKNVGQDVNVKQLSKKTISEIMSKCFYKYTSSTNPVIDQHHIVLVLNEWCWFWILLDTLVSIFLIGLYFLIYKLSYQNIFTLVICLGSIMALMRFVWVFLKKYTTKEIEAIFSDPERIEEIKKNIDEVLKGALQCK
jgi:hypothetical protein